MKKSSFFAVAFVALLASCGGGNNQEATETQEKSFEQEQLEAFVKMQVDSIASEWAKYQDVPFLASIHQGKFELSDEEKLVKPEYLLETSQLSDLVSLSQKYRALAMLDIDCTIAKAYDMPAEDFESAMAKLVVDIDDSAIEDFSENMNEGMAREEAITTLYDTEDENGRINFFWEAMTAAFVEQVYILANHPDNQFTNCFDDDAAAEFCYRFILIQQSLEQLAEYDPNIAELAQVIKPLDKLNAVSLEQFKTQLADMRNDIAEIREAMLK